MTAEQDSRAQFEAWAKDEGLDVERSAVTPETHYVSRATQDRWVAWQASRAALSAEPVAVPQGYDSGVQTGNRVTLVFDTQSNASAWFEKFCDDYDASAGTTTIKLPIPAAAAPQPAAQERDTASIEAAAKKLAESFDYQWEHMTEEGRENMRKNVRRVFAAAQPAAQERKPLTDAEIDALWGGENVTIPQLVNRRAISRSIERAHGITGEAA